MRKDLDRFFNHFLHSFTGAPSIDIHETEDELIATCDIPGVENKENIQILIDNYTLSISGVTEKSHEVNEKNMHRKERFVGRFQRSVSLPLEVSSTSVKASYKNGVLRVHMPKVKSGNKKRIDVNFD
jgi:HSP20 family protein